MVTPGTARMGVKRESRSLEQELSRLRPCSWQVRDAKAAAAAFSSTAGNRQLCLAAPRTLASSCICPPGPEEHATPPLPNQPRVLTGWKGSPAKLAGGGDSPPVTAERGRDCGDGGEAGLSRRHKQATAPSPRRAAARLALASPTCAGKAL